MSTIAPVALKKMMESGQDLLLIDIREPEAHEKFNIGGECFPLNQLYVKILQLGPPADIFIVIYCNKGKRGRIAKKVLHRAGYDNTAHLVGGLEAWREIYGDSRD